MEPDFALVKLEGDAVFAAAPAASLDGQGDRVLGKLEAKYGAFIDGRTRAIPASDHLCTACPAVAHLDLKVVLHLGPAVRQAVGSGSRIVELGEPLHGGVPTWTSGWRLLGPGGASESLSVREGQS